LDIDSSKISPLATYLITIAILEKKNGKGKPKLIFLSFFPIFLPTKQPTTKTPIYLQEKFIQQLPINKLGKGKAQKTEREGYRRTTKAEGEAVHEWDSNLAEDFEDTMLMIWGRRIWSSSGR
jgi:hypothetical protein